MYNKVRIQDFIKFTSNQDPHSNVIQGDVGWININVNQSLNYLDKICYFDNVFVFYVLNMQKFPICFFSVHKNSSRFRAGRRVVALAMRPVRRAWPKRPRAGRPDAAARLAKDFPEGGERFRGMADKAIEDNVAPEAFNEQLLAAIPGRH